MQTEEWQPTRYCESCILRILLIYIIKQYKIILLNHTSIIQYTQGAPIYSRNGKNKFQQLFERMRRRRL